MPLAILRPGDARVAPVVCVHPVSGRAADYQLLAGALDWPGPVLGFSAPEPRRNAGEPDYSLSELASQYCDQLDLAMPQLLLGWSIGGVIAAELSRIIVTRGGAVTFVGAPPRVTMIRDRKSTRLNSSHSELSRMPSSA